MDIPTGCQHYTRGCELYAKCCDKFFPCRICHDEYYAERANLGHIHTINRYEVEKVRCLKCGLVQKPCASCIGCSHLFGRYYCDICHLFDNDESKEIYHCHKCNMCRIGLAEDSVHCDKCGICYYKSSIEEHLCIEDLGNRSCPI